MGLHGYSLLPIASIYMYAYKVLKRTTIRKFVCTTFDLFISGINFDSLFGIKFDSNDSLFMKKEGNEIFGCRSDNYPVHVNFYVIEQNS